MKHNISNLVAGLYQYYFVERKPQLITLARISDLITWWLDETQHK